jgi:hypothetical protein
MRPRKARLRVTLYSEPGYRGLRQSFGAPSYGAYALSRTRLPAVGSIRVERFYYTFRRASAFWMLLRSVITGQGDEEAVGWLPLAAILALSPTSWTRMRDPAGDRQSWVRLWSGPPGSSLGDLPSRDFLEDTADVGAWGASVRYIKIGVRTPGLSWRRGG